MTDSIAAIIAAQDARDAALASFLSANAGRSFGATPRKSTGLSRIIVSPCTTNRGGWRLTRFDERGPSGHTEFATYAEAVTWAVRDYGVELGTVALSS